MKGTTMVTGVTMLGVSLIAVLVAVWWVFRA
jgi:hypothetical protein